jgi:hypothetical protein
MVKRFKIETSTYDQKFVFISESAGSKLYFASMEKTPLIKYSYNVGKAKEEKEVALTEFIDVKGWKALGNKLIDAKLLKVEKLVSEQQDEEIVTNLEIESEESNITDSDFHQKAITQRKRNPEIMKGINLDINQEIQSNLIFRKRALYFSFCQFYIYLCVENL